MRLAVILAVALLVLIAFPARAVDVRLKIQEYGHVAGVPVEADDEVVDHPFRDMAQCEDWKYSLEFEEMLRNLFAGHAAKGLVIDRVVRTCVDEAPA